MVVEQEEQSKSAHPDARLSGPRCSCVQVGQTSRRQGNDGTNITTMCPRRLCASAGQRSPRLIDPDCSGGCNSGAVIDLRSTNDHSSHSFLIITDGTMTLPAIWPAPDDCCPRGDPSLNVHAELTFQRTITLYPRTNSIKRGSYSMNRIRALWER
uniref:Uncharacterized protein n=1 Tax=Steinernema glaseri TaxID=37863 RepID=A0A1I7ZY76_9BILA